MGDCKKPKWNDTDVLPWKKASSGALKTEEVGEEAAVSVNIVCWCPKISKLNQNLDPVGSEGGVGG